MWTLASLSSRPYHPILHVLWVRRWWSMNEETKHLVTTVLNLWAMKPPPLIHPLGRHVKDSLRSLSLGFEIQTKLPWSPAMINKSRQSDSDSSIKFDYLFSSSKRRTCFKLRCNRNVFGKRLYSKGHRYHTYKCLHGVYDGVCKLYTNPMINRMAMFVLYGHILDLTFSYRINTELTF